MEGGVVKLIIKAPNQEIKDQVVQCNISWTIGQLKEYLSEVYPSKPVSSITSICKSCSLLTFGESEMYSPILSSVYL